MTTPPVPALTASTAVYWQEAAAGGSCCHDAAPAAGFTTILADGVRIAGEPI